MASHITGLSQCIEPTYQNLYVKSNLSGEFTVVNEFLVRDLKNANIWNKLGVLWVMAAADDQAARQGVRSSHSTGPLPAV